jgi:GR25 family glycosyltransferase involved in LPS biosynthesis
LQTLLAKLIPNYRSTFDDVLWRAVFLMPISYFRIHVLEDRHLRPIRPDYEYHLRNNNTFVINLDSDTQRWEQYQQMNKIGSRFAAVDFSSWLNRRKYNKSASTTTPTFTTTRIHEEEEEEDVDDDDGDLQLLLEQYPNLANLVKAGRFGEAGVMASHLRVYGQILQRNLSYAFIFEDDVLFRLSENHSQNGDDIVIRAPHPADVIFLTSTILRATHIQIPASVYDENNHTTNNNVVIRVMGGSGTYGILVTRQGAMKLLSLLRNGSCGYFDVFHDCRVDPLDIAIMKLAARRGLQMYTPFPARPVQFFHSNLGKASSAKALRDSSHTNK